MPPGIFDPKLLVISFANCLVTGVAEGTFIECEPDEEGWKKKVGSQGDVARLRNRNRSGSVKVTLLQTSPTNSIFLAAYQLDQVSGAGVYPFLAKDLSGQTMISAQNGWLKALPKVAFSNEIESREWVIDCDVLDYLGM